MNHSLQFHKRSNEDGSAKCDAFFTGESTDIVWGVMFEIESEQKPRLDRAEGLGRGYTEKQVTVFDADGGRHPVFMYAAEKRHIDPILTPYSWYKRFVVEGAHQHHLPADYVAGIEAVKAIEDPDRERDSRNRRILC